MSVGKISYMYLEPLSSEKFIKLYYRTREKTVAEAEIAYLIQHNAAIIPIEVKAGATGTLRSFHIFIKAKGLK
jgi:uncharacterized protein